MHPFATVLVRALQNHLIWILRCLVGADESKFRECFRVGEVVCLSPEEPAMLSMTALCLDLM